MQNIGLKFKLNSISIINIVTTLSIILLSGFLYYTINNAYIQRVFMMRFNEKVQTVRITEKAYLQFYNEKHIKELGEKVSGIIENVKSSSMINSIKKQLIDTINQYKEKFNQLVDIHEQGKKVVLDIIIQTDKINKDMMFIYLKLQDREYEKMITGGNLTPNEASLATLTRNVMNFLLTIKNEYLRFLYTGDYTIMEKIYENFDAKVVNIASPLRMISDQTKEQIFIKRANSFEPEVKKVLKKLQESEDLFRQEQDVSLILDKIGNDLLKFIENLLQQSLKKTNTAIKQSMVVISIIIILGVGISTSISTLIGKNIISTIIKIVDFAELVRKGNLEKKLTITNRDELGKLSVSLNDMVESLAKSKLYQENNVIKLQNLLEKITEISTKVNDSSEQLSKSSKTVLDEETASGEVIADITYALQQLNTKINVNNENSNKTNDKAANTKDFASKGSEKIEILINKMEDINESSKEISGIINVVNNIAEQTNLLALNAAIEAARAGEAGRGFAVVADEVRTLAKSSSEAAKNTNQLIEHSANIIQEGLIATEKTAEMFSEIVELSNEMSVLMQQISTSSNEQNDGINQINGLMKRIEDTIAKNIDISKDTAIAAEELAKRSIELNKTLKFTDEI